MIKLTKSQKEELEVWEYFIPMNVEWLPKTDNDIKMFFDWAERGKHKDRQMIGDLSYFEALRQGKRWAGIHWAMYEQGVLDGTMPYYTLLGGVSKKRKWWQFWKPKWINEPIPRAVVNQMKKEMFKGQDADLIEEIYAEII